LYAEMLQKRLATADANDMLYAFDASRDYDPSPKLESIEAPLLAVNSADDLINPPELGILERQIQRVRRGKAVVLPITPDTRGHGTHSLPALWKQHLGELLQRSGQVAAKSPTSADPTGCVPADELRALLAAKRSREAEELVERGATQSADRARTFREAGLV